MQAIPAYMLLGVLAAMNTDLAISCFLFWIAVIMNRWTDR